MLGCTCSNKRLSDPFTGGATSPSLLELIKILQVLPANTLRMVHYYTDNPDKLAEEVLRLYQEPWPFKAAGYSIWPELSQAIQINQKWPDAAQIQQIKSKLDLITVLQLPREVLSQELETILAVLTRYQGQADYLLIDPSGGEGKDFDLEKSCDLLVSLDDALPNTTIGVAGGFSAENVADRINNIYTKVKRPFCVDAQGKLRTQNRLDHQKCQNYLQNAVEAWLQIYQNST